MRGRDYLEYADEGVFSGVALFADLLVDFWVGGLEVVAGLSVVVHEGDEALVVHIDELVLSSLHGGALHVVGGRADIFVFLAILKNDDGFILNNPDAFYFKSKFKFLVYFSPILLALNSFVFA